jgi:hypothetical protein
LALLAAPLYAQESDDDAPPKLGKQKVHGAAAEGGEGDEDDEAETAPEKPSGPALVLTSNGKKLTHTCGGKSATHVTITGNGNKITLKGRCDEVTITGNQNQVTAEVIGKITAIGNNISVVYKQGLDGKPPKIVQTGTQVTVTKAKS